MSKSIKNNSKKHNQATFKGETVINTTEVNQHNQPLIITEKGIYTQEYKSAIPTIEEQQANILLNITEEQHKVNLSIIAETLKLQEEGKTAQEKAQESLHIINLTVPFKGFTKVGKGQGILVTIAGRDFKISNIHFSGARVIQEEKGQKITFNYSIKDFQNRERKEYSQLKSTHYPTKENINTAYSKESIGYKELKTA